MRRFYFPKYTVQDIHPNGFRLCAVMDCYPNSGFVFTLKYIRFEEPTP